nr:hypothetical protein [Parabacteroides sp. AF48-14]
MHLYTPLNHPLPDHHLIRPAVHPDEIQAGGEAVFRAAGGALLFQQVAGEGVDGKRFFFRGVYI